MQPSGKDAGQPTFTQGEVPDENQMTDLSNEAIDVKIGPRAHALIGQRLKLVYDELVKEPVPDHLLKLLEALEQKEKEG